MPFVGGRNAMHILYHHRTAGDRVEGVHIMGMVRAWRAMGHTVAICSPPGCDPEASQRAGGKAALRGATPHEGPLRALLKRFARKAPPVLFEFFELAYNAYSLAAMLRLARRQRPDMIYERTTANSVAPTLLARLWRVPIVQEVNVTASTGRFRPLVLRYLTLRLERWMARNASLIVTVSNEFKRRIVSEGFPAGRTLVCQNAIEPNAFDPDTVQETDLAGQFQAGAVVAGYVGSFLPYHRLDILVDAAQRLAPLYPQLHWLLVGDGVERSRIEGVLKRNALAERFCLAGHVSHHLVPGYVKVMDIAVLPSSGEYNSPMKLFEYMAMGRAVVVPDTPAIREVIQHGRNGLLFRAGDADALAAQITGLLDDEDMRRRIGRQAREDVLREHNWPRVAQRVLDRVKQSRQQECGTA